MSKTLRCIQISDLHITKETEIEYKVQVINPLLDELKKINTEKKIDLVFITGDLINQGNAGCTNNENPFDYANSIFIQPLIQAIGISQEDVLLCPGNHDMVTSDDTLISEKGILPIEPTDTDVKEALSEFEKGHYEGALRVTKYNEFCKNFYKNDPESKSSFLYQTHVKEINGIKIGIACLNSSWRYYPDRDKKMIIGSNQLVKSIDELNDCKLNILMSHYYFEEIIDFERKEIEELANNFFDIQLFGHTHSPKAYLITTNGKSRFRNIEHGIASFNIESKSIDYQNGFSVLDYFFDEGVERVVFTPKRFFHVSNSFDIDLDVGGEQIFELTHKTETPVTINQDNQSIDKLVLKEDFNNFLHKVDFESENQTNEKSDLETFFCYPEFSVHSDDKKDPEKEKSEDVVKKIIEKPFNSIIYGSEQYGKTTLAKKYFSDLFLSGYMPIYIQFKQDEKGFLSNKISDAIKYQYEKNIDTYHKILILDDFHKLNQKNKKKVIEYIQKEGIPTIIFVNPEFSDHIDNETLVTSYKHYTIRSFGHKKRNELISAWIEFNSTKYSDVNYTDLDNLTEFVENTLQKGLIPYTPFYILTILAAKRDLIKLDTEITSKGSCYQALVIIALKNMNLQNQTEINVVQNFFGFIAYQMYEQKLLDYTEEELKELFESFVEKYNWDISFEEVLALLNKNNIFSCNSMNLYSFTGIYYYYFFVARYLSNKLTDQKFYAIAKNMVENLQNRDNSYIFIFLIHHTRNLILFDEVQLASMLIYEKKQEIKISKEETKEIEKSIKKLKDITISAQDNSSKVREMRNDIADQHEENEEELSNQEINEEIIRLKKSLKTVEVLGQILKNHNGEIDKEKIISCINEGMKALERTCQNVIDQFHECENEYVDFLRKKLEEKEELSTLSSSEKTTLIHNIINSIYFQSMYSTIIRCGDALGSKEMVNLFKHIYETEKTPISFCVYIYCSLWYKKQPPISDIKKEYGNLPLTAQTMLKFLIKDYTEMHPINYQDKQKLADILNIKVNKLQIDYSK